MVRSVERRWREASNKRPEYRERRILCRIVDKVDGWKPGESENGMQLSVTQILFVDIA